MKVAAVIAEYNPFHTGHQYHLAKTKELNDVDYILVIMSGNFVQRGAPALLDKYTRTHMALLGGADAVIELPTIYATSSAEYFAQSSISLANRLGVVDLLSFGSEAGSLPPLMDTASALLSGETGCQATLQALLKQGISYPAAREKSIAGYLSSYPKTTQDSLTTPNNILGVEYCRALLSSKSSIAPFTIPRQGKGFHDTHLEQDGNSYVSASAIRSFLEKNSQINPDRQPKEKDLAALSAYIPAESRAILWEMVKKNSCIKEDDLSLLMYYKLLSEKEQGFDKYLDCSPDLSAKITKSISEYAGYSSFCKLLKSKDITYSRVSRMLLHILLGMTTPSFYRETYSEREYFLPYGRLLGFRKGSTALLSSIKKNSSIPLITKLPDAQKTLTGDALAFLNKEIYFTSIYEAVLQNKNKYQNNKTALDELRQSPVIIP